MSLGAWIKGKRAELQQNAIQLAVDKAFASLDSWGAKRWPVGWIRVRRMGVGWKTIGGVLLMYAPEILEHAPTVAAAFGLDDAQTQAVVTMLGKGLFFIGLADKYVKFSKPIERRQGAREVTSESGARYVLSPVSSEPKAPVMAVPKGMTDEARVVFDNVIAAETKAGVTVEAARESAVEAAGKVKP